MRSASSTCAGRPEAIRPATYLTSGEYATTRRSRARGSPSRLYWRHRSFSSTDLTLVSIPLGPGMRPRVGTLQASRLYPSVDLGRRYGGVAEQLLDRPQVRAALEQMRRERMPQRVRMHAALDRR